MRTGLHHEHPQLHHQRHRRRQHPFVLVPCEKNYLTTTMTTEWTWMPGLDGIHLHHCKGAHTHLRHLHRPPLLLATMKTGTKSRGTRRLLHHLRLQVRLAESGRGTETGTTSSLLLARELTGVTRGTEKGTGTGLHRPLQHRH